MFCFSILETFILGPSPTIHRKTLVPLKLEPGQEFSDDLKLWGLRLDRKIPSSNDILLQVHIAPDVPVGIWNCTVNEKKVIATTTYRSIGLIATFLLSAKKKYTSSSIHGARLIAYTWKKRRSCRNISSMNLERFGVAVTKNQKEGVGFLDSLMILYFQQLFCC